MKYYTEYKEHTPDILGKRKKFDNTIYTFDIETTSYIILDNKQISAIDYDKLNEKEKEKCDFRSCMYIWMFGINDIVYYGRTWKEFKEFIKIIDNKVPDKKYLFIHNLAFEFQYLKSVLQFDYESVIARKSHKVMSAILEKYNFELRCTYMMSNCALKYLPDLFKLPVKKMVGDLDYSKIRHSKTPLSDKELGYCEHDCLVLYHYILYELQTYDNVKVIPATSTGHVRRELKSLVLNDYKYRRIVNKAINTDPHIYNLLQDAFMGGYTHANWIYTDSIVENIDSWDFTSSYPYVLTTFKYPSTEFVKSNIKKLEEMSTMYAYLIVVKFTNIKCKYFNTFISQSKCKNIKGAKYDNGRVMEAEELTIVLTDVDFKFILKAYDLEYEILECYQSLYNYLPKKFINFVLDKYTLKTQYKGVIGKELEYQKEKGKFNSLYGMSVTNTIRDKVIFDENDWHEEELTNEEIEEQLLADKKASFLSFAYGVWVTAHARNNLLSNVIKLDEYVVYCDTDSMKLLPGYDKRIIEDYNKKVEHRINYVSKTLKIDKSKFAPRDVKGKERMLGLFDDDGHYEKFITQGAKKYCYTTWMKKKDCLKEDGTYKDSINIQEVKEDKVLTLNITVSGVPKTGARALKKIDEFRDNFVFNFKDTNKNLLMYCENQEEFELTDYLGNKEIVSDKSGCCLLPTTYVLGKALEYADLITDSSSHRARYKE